MKKHAILSLKWPVFVGKVGRASVVRTETLGASGPSFQARVHAVWTKGKWRQVQPVELTIYDDCVVSRQYVEPAPEQLRLPMRERA